ncbi:hypothetical protein D9M71_117550 [compost metagenome]
MVRGHALHGVLGAQDRPHHVGLHDLEQAEFGHLLDPGLLPHGAGVVDQRRDPAQFGVDAVEQVHHFIFDADIGAHGNGLCTQFAHLLEHALGCLFVGLVVDADAVALAGGEQRGGGANAATGTGDDDDFFHGQFLAPVR